MCRGKICWMKIAEKLPGREPYSLSQHWLVQNSMLYLVNEHVATFHYKKVEMQSSDVCVGKHCNGLMYLTYAMMVMF